MIRIKITWPTLILILIALLVWLARDPGQRPASRRRPPSRPTPQPRRRDRPIVIDQQPAREDYDAETERLDREAAEAARSVFEETDRRNQTIIEELNKRNDRRKYRFHASG